MNFTLALLLTVGRMLEGALCLHMEEFYARFETLARRRCTQPSLVYDLIMKNYYQLDEKAPRISTLMLHRERLSRAFLRLS